MLTRKKNIKIVIVEDDIYLNRILSKYISTICNGKQYDSLKFEIESYRSAHDCIEKLSDDIDIMILDYFLINKDEIEELNGLHVLEEVREHCPNCKVIVVSSLKDKNTVERILSIGIHEYVDKNVNSNNRIGSVVQKIITQENKNNATF